MDKTVELMREYVRVADMCQNTDVKSWECVKFNGAINFTCRHPSFDRNNEYYEFAIAILEDKPVFVGDVVFDKRCQVTERVSADSRICDSDYTWTQPAKKCTFILELNKEEINYLINRLFYFNVSGNDLYKKLTEARDKE